MPIERLFNVDLTKIDNKVIKNIWHVGRFAISKGQKDGAWLLKKLITLAIYPICQDEESVMVAECDSKFMRGLNLIGIRTGILAPAIQYLGSETLPIYSTRDWLLTYLNKSSYLKDATKIFKRNALKPLSPIVLAKEDRVFA